MLFQMHLLLLNVHSITSCASRVISGASRVTSGVCRVTSCEMNGGVYVDTNENRFHKSDILLHSCLYIFLPVINYAMHASLGVVLG
jgi:hypothetical protein